MKNVLVVSVALVIFFLTTIPAYAYDKTSPPSNGGITTISNGVLDVHIEDTLVGTGFGTYTVSTGSAHSNPGQNVFYGGAADNPWSSYNTITIWDTDPVIKKHYITSNDPSISPSPGFIIQFLDAFNPVILTSTPTQLEIEWGPTPEWLWIRQDIEVLGTTLTDTKVRVTMGVRNGDTVPHRIAAIRYEWDLKIDDMDGSWLRPWIDSSTPGTLRNTEFTWAAPFTFQFWETTNYPTNLFSINGSISEPSALPIPATPPSTFFKYADWGGAYSTASMYTTAGATIGGSDPCDSSVIYYWDPIPLQPGEEFWVTAYLWTPSPPLPPVANFTWTPSIPKVDESVAFDASSSTPNGGEIVNYAWSFGDGHHGTGEIATYTYVSPGTYTVTLNVTDSEGLWDIEQKQIQVVQPYGPEAESTATPDTALTDESIEFDASASLPGWNGTREMPIVEYRWDFGDGNKTTTSSPTVYHSFSSSGIYCVTLTVYAPGATPETDSTTHRVTVISTPVGGYSFPIEGYATTKPLAVYLALAAIFTVSFTMIKRKTHRRTKQS